MKKVNKEPNILYWDIETSLMTVHTFSLWPEHIPIEYVLEDWRILCIGYAWNDEKRVVLTGTEESIVKKFYKILNEADIIVYHNGDKFDLKKFKARAMQYGLPPVKKFNSANTVDTLKVVKKEFALSSNKLDYITRKVLNIGGKISTDKYLWIKATAGDVKSLAKMAFYCGNDVDILRKAYKKLRPYVSNHPNMGHYIDHGVVCPNCGSKHVRKQGYRVTRTGKYQQYQCGDCGSWSQGKTNLNSLENR